MEVTLLDWEEGTADFAHHRVVQKYIQDISTKAGVQDITEYGARVVDTRKNGAKWDVSWTTLSKESNLKLIEVVDIAVSGMGMSKKRP
jgi:uncharacterized membrane-anchored protein